MRSLTRAEVRDVDRRAIEEYGLPGVVLMENAGRNAAALLESQGISGLVAVVCGKGNNAGDGFVIARHLQNHGHDVRVLLACDPQQYTGDAAINYRVIERAGTPIVRMDAASPAEWSQALSSAEWIVDALLGTGLTGTVREPFATVIAAINAAGKKVFAVDLPSGLDCDTGQPLGGCVRATLTGTFVARKIGFEAPGAEAWTGPVRVLDIGVPKALLHDLA
uniref:NAD(P)H-hydrate epimerase n=1 Tax=Schlesneria paludicola TaxID=360056 RepID=A0A7C2NXF9_9PLAN